MTKETQKDIGISLLLFTLAVALDQILKHSFKSGGVHYNPGLVFGIGHSLPVELRLVGITTFFGFIFFFYICFLIFLPSKFSNSKKALSLFVGGIGGNVIDKAILGAAIDFIPIPFTNIFFNPADFIQWIGVFIIALEIFFNSKLAPIENNKRGSGLVKPKEQFWFASKFSAIAFCCSLLLGFFAYTFLRASLLAHKNAQTDDMLLSFAVVYIALTAVFTLIVFLAGIVISQRTYGPIYAFERYMTDVFNDKDEPPPHLPLKLREGDYFPGLIDLAEKIKSKLSKAA